jgi:hypothetical protein
MVSRYAYVLGTANTQISASASRHLAERLIMISAYYELDPALLTAIVTSESSWRERAVSPVGALGYGQLMPGTAASLHVEPFDGTENLDGTARYLRRMLKRYAHRSPEQQMRCAIASYNAGPGAVDRYGGVPPFRETTAYVAHVLRLRALYADSGSGVPMQLAREIIAARTPPTVVSVTIVRKTHATHRHVTRTRPVRVTAERWTPKDSPYLHALDPNAYETPAPRVRHGIAGLMHRLFHPEPASSPAAAVSYSASAR